MHGFPYSVWRDPPVRVLELLQSGDDLLRQFFLSCLEAMVLALLPVLSDSLCHQGPHLGITKECSTIYPHHAAYSHFGNGFSTGLTSIDRILYEVEQFLCPF